MILSPNSHQCLLVCFSRFLIIDVPSQAAGSLGTVLAWDLRMQQQPIILSGTGAGDGACKTAVQSISESEVWEVQYDRCIKSNTSSSRILPAMICSEDGILGVIEQGIYVHCNLHVKNVSSSGIYLVNLMVCSYIA